MGPVWEEMEELVTWDVQKAEVLNGFLLWSSPVSAPTTAPESQTKGGTGRKRTTHSRKR